jgi:hypothetical protein
MAGNLLGRAAVRLTPLTWEVYQQMSLYRKPVAPDRSARLTWVGRGQRGLVAGVDDQGVACSGEGGPAGQRSPGPDRRSSSRRGHADAHRAGRQASLARTAIHSGGAVPAPARCPDPLLLRPAGMAVVRLPDHLRPPAGQCGDAQRQPPVQPAGGDPPGRVRGHVRPADPGHRRVHAAGTCGTISATCICCSRSRAGRVALLAR